jgi:hypothetical protein
MKESVQLVKEGPCRVTGCPGKILPTFLPVREQSIGSPIRQIKNAVPSGNRVFVRGADGGIRTPDPFITSEVLCQLSYVSITE